MVIEFQTYHFCFLKFNFSKKATKIWCNRPQDFDVMSKPWGRLIQIFEAFSKKLNFKRVSKFCFNLTSFPLSNIQRKIFWFTLNKDFCPSILIKNNLTIMVTFLCKLTHEGVKLHLVNLTSLIHYPQDFFTVKVSP